LWCLISVLVAYLISLRDILTYISFLLTLSIYYVNVMTPWTICFQVDFKQTSRKNHIWVSDWKISLVPRIFLVLGYMGTRLLEYSHLIHHSHFISLCWNQHFNKFHMWNNSLTRNINFPNKHFRFRERSNEIYISDVKIKMCTFPPQMFQFHKWFVVLALPTSYGWKFLIIT
jgi:hypothetical protein